MLDEEGAAKAAGHLRDLFRITSRESVEMYIAKLPRIPKERLPDVLSVLLELPRYTDINDPDTKLSSDFRKWFLDMHAAQSSIFHSLDDFSMDDYRRTLERMNPRIDLPRYEQFWEEFGAQKEIAEDHSFKSNEYHTLLLQILY